MAAPQLFLCIISFLCLSPSLAFNHISVEEKAVYKKVNVSLYYEALCPGCEEFIVNNLEVVFKTDLINIVNLRLIPWGNAELEKNGTIVCQHGEEECALNAFDACILNTWPDSKQHFGLIRCVENATNAEQPRNPTGCFGKKYDLRPVMQCYKSGKGKQLVLRYGKETSKLVPPHKFVPWVVVNDKAIEEDFDNFVKYVCEAYEGPKPKACKSLMTTTDRFDKANHPPRVCYGTSSIDSATANK